MPTSLCVLRPTISSIFHFKTVFLSSYNCIPIAKYYKMLCLEVVKIVLVLFSVKKVKNYENRQILKYMLASQIVMQTFAGYGLCLEKIRFSTFKFHIEVTGQHWLMVKTLHTLYSTNYCLQRFRTLAYIFYMLYLEVM